MIVVKFDVNELKVVEGKVEIILGVKEVFEVFVEVGFFVIVFDEVDGGL